MSDSIGATAVPLVAPAGGQADTDPLLTYCLAFFKAIANAHAATAWQAVAPGTLPVDGTFAHDPEQQVFNVRSLPALFMWRDSLSIREDVAIDIEEWRGEIKLLWMPTLASQELRALRDPFAKGLFNTLSTYFERGTDPAWQIVGDTYPTANYVATYGSVLPHYAKFKRMYLGSWKRRPVNISMSEPVGTNRSYFAFESTWPCEEWRSFDITRFDALAGIDQKINVPADDAGNPEQTLFEDIFT